MTQITIMLPNTNFQRPTAAELASLFKIVASAHPGEASQVDLAEFGRAFFACGYMFRTAAPRQDRYFVRFVERANAFLGERWGCEGVSGPALFLAVRAHNDIPWRPQDQRIGQLSEVGLNEHNGIRLRQPNAWRELLRGVNLLAPLPPRELLRRQVEPSPMRICREGPNGGWRPVGDYETLW